MLNKEKEKYEEDVRVLHAELALQREKSETCAKALITANRELTYQKEEKEKCKAELIVAKERVANQIDDEERYTETLIDANEELAFQNGEKRKRVIELVKLIKELFKNNKRKVERKEQSVSAAKELASRNYEKVKLTKKLSSANHELKIAEEKQEDYRQSLEKLMFITSHQLRGPIAQILAILDYLETLGLTIDEIEEMNGYLKNSAKTLDKMTRELTTIINNQRIKLKK